jgi:preprotein translocase subunit YajC
MNSLHSLATWLPVLLAQEEGGGGGPMSLLLGPWFPFIIIGVMFYFLLIRPERRKRAEMSQMLEALKKNDRVVTIGGIHGVVINAGKDSDEVTIRVDEGNNTKLRIQRSAVSRVVPADEGEEKEG